MNVILPKDLNKTEVTHYSNLITNKVYQFGELLVCETSNDCIIAVDIDDNTILTFNDSDDFGEWLSGNERASKGELTPFQMTLTVK